MPGRGISLQKPSVPDWGRPQCEGELWRRLRISRTIVSNIEDFAIFSFWPAQRGQPGESLRWSEGLSGKLRLGARKCTGTTYSSRSFQFRGGFDMEVIHLLARGQTVAHNTQNFSVLKQIQIFGASLYYTEISRTGKF